MNQNYTILVNSSDGFEDCWKPFFTLFKKYWPNCNANILLNTENKNWQDSDLNIKCTQVQGKQEKRLSWSECLIRALDQIDTPLILYFQEDYFIHQPVRNELIDSAVNHMMDNPEVKHIALTRHGSLGPYDSYHLKDFELIRQNASYRISTQAALWRVEALKAHLRSEENGWMFEIYGTWRARNKVETFLTTRFDPDFGGAVIEYLHTGIIKGKWLSEIQPIFALNGIEVDYTKRGFYKPKPNILRKMDLALKLLSRPIYFIRQLPFSSLFR
jgi:hypothetical protein